MRKTRNPSAAASKLTRKANVAPAVVAQHAAAEYLTGFPALYAKQADAIYCPERYGICEASTKSGKTLGCMRWLLEQAAEDEAAGVYWWLAPSYAQSKIVFRRYLRAIPRNLRTADKGELSIELANGAIIFCKTGEEPDLLYGEDVCAAVIDEASRCREDAYWAVRSTLTHTEGPIRIIGNVRGRKNWAYILARKAEEGTPGFHYSKLISADAVRAGVLSASEIEDAKNALPEDVFKELYLAIATESGANPFGSQHIRECIAPLARGPARVYGVDIARGRTAASDYTCIIGLNAERHVCFFERLKGPFGLQMARIKAVVGSTPCLCDETGLGMAVVEELQREYGSKYTGYRFSLQSKQSLIEGLAVVIQRGEIRFPEGIITDELDEFGYEVTRTGVRYGALVGHDDAVCALALANYHFADAKPVRQRFDRIAVFTNDHGLVPREPPLGDEADARARQRSGQIRTPGWPGLNIPSGGGAGVHPDDGDSLDDPNDAGEESYLPRRGRIRNI